MKTRTDFFAAGIFLAALVNGFGQPMITSQPQSVTNLAGTTAAFSIAVTATSPFAYQWLLNSTIPLSSATNADLILTNVQSFNTGGYSVVVTNSEGSVTSVVAMLTVLTPPKIAKQPTNQTASLFADATFRLTATGDAPFYQWRFNDADLIGKTNTTLTVTNVQRADGGNYNVVVTNLSGSVTSQVATLTVTPFNSIYFFGFSWTGTSGLAPDGSSCGWNFPRYYQHRACNGPMWPEFLSTNLGLVYAEAKNYGQCGATSLDILNQVINFPAPPKPKLSLYCLWADGPDVDFTTMVNALTNEAAGNRLLQTTLLNISNSVNRLYTKGARAIFVQWSSAGTWVSALARESFLSLLGTNTALLTKNNEYEARFSAGFLDTINSYSQTRPDLRILLLNVFSKINNVLANPVQYGFTKTTISALDDQALTDKSFSGPGSDYLYWDIHHGTSKLHKLIAAWHLDALTNSVLETLDVTIASGLPNIQMNRLQIGRDYTLQKSTELKTWTDVQSFTASTGTNQWSSSLGNDLTAYFRLKWQR